MDRRALLSGKFTEDTLNLSNSEHSVYAYAKLLGSTDNAMVHFSLEEQFLRYYLMVLSHSLVFRQC